MTYSSKWLRLCEAEEEYRACQDDFMRKKEEMVINLKKALASVDDNETALRLLASMKPSLDVLIPLLSTVIDLSIDSSRANKIVLAREVLA